MKHCRLTTTSRMASATRAAQHGFTLLEVLIALVVFSVGLHGLAALQSFSVKTNQSAHFRSQAIMLSNMIIDDMRANRNAVLTGKYFASYATSTCADSATEPTGSGPDHDVAVWRWRIACMLPGGQGKIEFPGDQVVVSIRWGDERWNADAAQTEFSIASRL
jgi:type IV pilus assembly protein PilV